MSNFKRNTKDFPLKSAAVLKLMLDKYAGLFYDKSNQNEIDET